MFPTQMHTFHLYYIVYCASIIGKIHKTKLYSLNASFVGDIRKTDFGTNTATLENNIARPINLNHTMFISSILFSNIYLINLILQCKSSTKIRYDKIKKSKRAKEVTVRLHHVQFAPCTMFSSSTVTRPLL